MPPHLSEIVNSSTSSYISIGRYANDRISKEEDKENKILTFLEHLFNNKTVLFIGYGLDELEILEYVMLKAKKINKENKTEVKHYLLNGFFSHEAQLVKNLGDYYAREFGIKLLPFLRDGRNWGQLLPVLEDLALGLRFLHSVSVKVIWGHLLLRVGA